MTLIEGPTYQRAKALAKEFKRTYYVNAHGYGANEYLLVETHRGGRCCAMAQPNGEIELVVQEVFTKGAKYD